MWKIQFKTWWNTVKHYWKSGDLDGDQLSYLAERAFDNGYQRGFKDGQKSGK